VPPLALYLNLSKQWEWGRFFWQGERKISRAEEKIGREEEK